MAEAYRAAAPAARMAGVEFEELTAILLVAHDFMLRGSSAGRKLQSIMMRISTEASEFMDAFQIAFDRGKPMKFMDIMDQLRKNMKKGADCSES